MIKMKLEESGRKLFGLWVVFLAVIYIFANLGKISWVLWIAVGSGLFLSVFLWGQVGATSYLKKKGWKSVSASDFVVWVTMFVSGVVFVNSLTLIPIIGSSVPQSILTFTRGIGITTGLIAGILALIFAFSNKPRA